MRKIIVEQGQIIVTDVVLISKSRNHRVWYIECHSKYPVLLGSSGTEILLHADERTLKCNRDALPTRIKFPVLEDWSLFSEEHGRYSMTVAAYRENAHRRIWHDYESDQNRE
jgi:hypothetical protein